MTAEDSAPLWRSESDDPAPARVGNAGDRTTAATALGRMRQGEALLYSGDFRNARQLLAAVERRLDKRRGSAGTSAVDAFRDERRTKDAQHQILSRLLVELDADYRLHLSNAPEVREACAQAWGPSGGKSTRVALRTLNGVLGAAEWRRKGLAVPGLEGKLIPHYGVFTPTRGEYVELVSRAVRETPAVRGARVFDIGTGTGVLGLLLLRHGAARVVATDTEPRAVACARENATRFGVASRFEVLERTLYPDGRADLVVCNPPWIPEPPKSRLDRAVYDDGSQFLRAFVAGLGDHLEPGGAGWLLLSNLPELLGLRPEGFVPDLFQAAGLQALFRWSSAARHPKSQDRSDPLHGARSRETTTLFVLAPTTATAP